MTKLVRPLDRLRAQPKVETASIADDAARTATMRATVLDALGRETAVRVDPHQRICLPVLKHG